MVVFSNLFHFFLNCVRYLHNNKITQLKNGLFENMVSLKRLRLDNNDFVCNCNILWLLKLLGKSRHIEADIVCKHPANLMGKNLIDLNETDLDCSKYSKLSTIAFGQPTPTIMWKVNGQPVDSSSRMFFGNQNTELHIEQIKESDEG